MGWLLALVPSEFLILFIAGLGLALITGILRPGAALSILGLLLLGVVLGPFVEGLMSSLPAGISLLLTVIVGLAILRGVLSLVIGRGATDHAVGALVVDAIRFALLLVFVLPFRILAGIVRGLGGDQRAP